MDLRPLTPDPMLFTVGKKDSVGSIRIEYSRHIGHPDRHRHAVSLGDLSQLA